MSQSRRLLAALALALPAARAGLLFALVDPVNETQPSFTALIDAPNSSFVPQGLLPLNLQGAEQLVALGSGRTLYTLYSNFSTNKMDLVGVDLMSGAVVSHCPTPLPMLGIEGDGQYMAFVPATNEVALVGALSETVDAEWRVMAVQPDSGKVRYVAKISGADFFTMGLGNYGGFSPISHTFWFQLRNKTNEEVTASFHVDMTTGEIRTTQGCWFASATYDSVRDEMVGFAVFRNGTTLKDVFIAVGRVPANASAPCRVGPIVFSEASKFGTVSGSLIAFDAESRSLYAYAAHSADLDVSTLIAVHSETGKFVEFSPDIPDDDRYPTAIVVSGMCDDGACADSKR